MTRCTGTDSTPDGEIHSVETNRSVKRRAADWLRYNSITGRAMTFALLAYEGRATPPRFGLGQTPARGRTMRAHIVPGALGVCSLPPGAWTASFPSRGDTM